MSPFKTVAELLEDPKRWCQGHSAALSDGSPTFSQDDQAVAWCVAGAIWVVYGAREKMPGRDETAFTALFRVIGVTSPGSFNDTHTHAEVLDAVRRAGI